MKDLHERLARRRATLGPARFEAGSEAAEFRAAEELRRMPRKRRGVIRGRRPDGSPVAGVDTTRGAGHPGSPAIEHATAASQQREGHDDVLSENLDQ